MVLRERIENKRTEKIKKKGKNSSENLSHQFKALLQTEVFGERLFNKLAHCNTINGLAGYRIDCIDLLSEAVFFTNP